MSAGAISLSASSISIVGSNAVSLNHYPDPKVKNTGIPKGITIDSTDVSFKVEDAYFEGKEKKSYPIEAEPEPAFSAPPKQIQEKKTNKVVGHKIEARVEDGNKTILKGLGMAALALGMAAAVIFTGGAALLAAGALMEGGLISTAIGAGVATIAGVGMGMGLEGAGMEANVAEATVEEGNNEINNGNQGIDEKGYNRIRDGEFGGDEEAYQKYQDQAIGLWETGVMINMTAATVGTEALPVAGVADAMYGDKISSTFSKVFQYREEELVCSSNPLLEMDGESKAISPEWQAYFDDIESNTGRKLTQNQKDLVIEEINNNPHDTKLTGQDYKDHRTDFNKQKDDLISQWEQNTDQTWPNYENDVLSKNGNAYIKAGDKYDAHEIIPNVYDSPLEWWNLHPAARPEEHQGGIHGTDGAIKDIFK